MRPVFSLGGVTLHTYTLGILGVAAAVIYVVWAWKKGRSEPFSGRHLFNLICITCLAGEAGCRLLGAAVALARFAAGAPGAALGDALATRVFYGTPLCIAAALWLYCRRYGQSFHGAWALILPSVPLFLALGRVGCYLGGCCYGVPMAFGPAYHGGPPRFPVQLAEGLFCLALWAALAWLSWRQRYRPAILPLFFLCYGIGRFLLELLRGDPARGVWLGLSTSQWFSLALVPCAAAYLLRLRRQQAPAPPAAPQSGA